MELMIFTIELPEKVKRGLLINIFYTLANVLPYVYLKRFSFPTRWRIRSLFITGSLWNSFRSSEVRRCFCQ